MTLWTLLRRVFRQRALERELDAELRDHIERQLADGVRGGRSLPQLNIVSTTAPSAAWAALSLVSGGPSGSALGS